eukprot:141093-Amphidinium_carterae.1
MENLELFLSWQAPGIVSKHCCAQCAQWCVLVLAKVDPTDVNYTAPTAELVPSFRDRTNPAFDKMTNLTKDVQIAELSLFARFLSIFLNFGDKRGVRPVPILARDGSRRKTTLVLGGISLFGEIHYSCSATKDGKRDSDTQRLLKAHIPRMRKTEEGKACGASHDFPFMRHIVSHTACALLRESSATF